MNHLTMIPIFFLIAIVFSMLGMGGSQIYIPILFWAGLDFKTAAIPLGMLLGVVNSSSAAVTYARQRLIDWRIGLLFGVSMLITAPFGAILNQVVPARTLIVIFAVFTAVSGILMWFGKQPSRRLEGGRRTALGLAGGGGLGFLVGLIGRGGGSFVVPLLYMTGVEAKTAAATSTLAVTFSGVSGFVSHLATAATPDWPLWGGCAAAVFAGSQIGSRVMAHHLKSQSLKKIFAIVLFGVAATLIVKDVLLVP